MRDLVARLMMALTVPATIVGVDAFAGAGMALRLESLAPLLWATAGLAAVLLLGRPHLPRGARVAASADEPRKLRNLRTAA